MKKIVKSGNLMLNVHLSINVFNKLTLNNGLFYGAIIKHMIALKKYCF